MIENHIIILIVLVTIILFILVSYFINPNHDRDVINEIIKKKLAEDTDPDTEYAEMEAIADKYHQEKMKIYITRSIVQGLLLFVSMMLITKYYNKRSAIVSNHNPFQPPNQPLVAPTMQPSANNYFKVAPWEM